MARFVAVVSFIVVLAGAVGASWAALGVDAQEGTPVPMTGHPLVGSWLAIAVPRDPGAQTIAVTGTFAADGSLVLGYPVAQVGPQGVAFAGPGIGRWESTGERAARFTVVVVLSDATGRSSVPPPSTATRR